jgi:hypothetical protein
MNGNSPVKRQDEIERDVTAWFWKNWFGSHAAHEFVDVQGKLGIREKPRLASHWSGGSPHADWSWRPRARTFEGSK